MVRQISVFMENRAGRLADICEVIADADANIRGFVISDTAQFGIVRFVLSHTDAAITALKEAGFTVTESPVLVLDLSADRPGGLAAVLKAVSEAGVNVEYAYSLVERFLALSVENIDSAEERVQNIGIPLLAQADIDAL